MQWIKCEICFSWLPSSIIRGLNWLSCWSTLACSRRRFCLSKETLIFNESLKSDQQWMWWHWQGSVSLNCTPVHIMMPSLRKLYRRTQCTPTLSIQQLPPPAPSNLAGLHFNYAKSPTLLTLCEEKYNQDSVNSLQHLWEEILLFMWLFESVVALNQQHKSFAC